MYVCRNCKRITMYRMKGLCEECVGKPTKKAKEWAKNKGLERAVFPKIVIKIIQETPSVTKGMSYDERLE